MTLTRLTLLALAAGPAFAQAPPSRLEFEVASIKPSPPITESVHIGIHIDGAQVNCTAFALKDYIRIAYRMKDYQVEVPDWVASDRYDISAKLPAGATRDQVNDMLQSLLIDRFNLKFHRTKKDFPVYALVVGKGGAKLKESDLGGIPASTYFKQSDNVAASGSGAGVNVDLGQGSGFTFADNKMQIKRLPTVRMVDLLARFLDRPIVDMTNLSGVYDLDLQVSPEDYRGMLIRSAITAGVVLPPEAQRMAMSDVGDSLATALQLVGLKLESRKAPLDVMVVDHMEHAPTDN